MTCGSDEILRMAGKPDNGAVLQLESVSVHYTRYSRGIVPRPIEIVRAVNDVSLSLGRNEILGIVGGSGSGKSSLVRVAMLIERPTHGSIRFNSVELTELTPAELAATRSGMQIVFQNPAASLNPDLTVEQVVREPLEALRIGSRAERRERVTEALRMVGLDAPDARGRPCEFSGGQQQRIAIARAIVVEPRVLFADEAISALDVSIGARILDLLLELRERLHFSMLFVSHDLAVVQRICDRVGVLYRGSLVELADTTTLYRQPQHEYTRTLLEAARHTELHA